MCRREGKRGRSRSRGGGWRGGGMRGLSMSRGAYTRRRTANRRGGNEFYETHIHSEGERSLLSLLSTKNDWQFASAEINSKLWR